MAGQSDIPLFWETALDHMREWAAQNPDKIPVNRSMKEHLAWDILGVDDPQKAAGPIEELPGGVEALYLADKLISRGWFKPLGNGSYSLP